MPLLYRYEHAVTDGWITLPRASYAKQGDNLHVVLFLPCVHNIWLYSQLYRPGSSWLRRRFNDQPTKLSGSKKWRELPVIPGLMSNSTGDDGLMDSKLLRER